MPLIIRPRRRPHMEVEFFLHPDPRASAAAHRPLSRDVMVRFSMPSGEELVRVAKITDKARFPAEWAQFEAKQKRKTNGDGSPIEGNHPGALDTGLHIEEVCRGNLQNTEPVKQKRSSGPPSTLGVRVATARHATPANENIVATIGPSPADTVTDPDADTPSAAATTEPAPPRDQGPAEKPGEQCATPLDAEAEDATPTLRDQNEIAGPSAAPPRQRRQTVPRQTPATVIQAVADALAAGLKARKALAARVKEKTGIPYSHSQIGRIVKHIRSS